MPHQLTIKKIYRLTERLHLLALRFAEKSAELGNFGKGFAIIAAESKQLATELETILDNLTSSQNQIADLEVTKLIDLAQKGALLAQNSYIETCRIGGDSQVILLVDVEELRKIFVTIIQLLKPSDLSANLCSYPRIAETNYISKETLNLALISTGEFLIAENLDFITEIHYYRQQHAVSPNHRLIIRGVEFPLIDLNLLITGKVLTNPQRVIFFDNLPSDNPDRPLRFALLADSSMFWRTQYGKSDAVIRDLFRECWLLTDGKTVSFLNWKKLLQQHEALFREPEFEDLLNLSDIEIQSTLKKCELSDLFFALKGCNPALKHKIEDNLSEKVKLQIKEESAKVEAVPLAEVEQAQEKIIRLAFGKE